MLFCLVTGMSFLAGCSTLGKNTFPPDFQDIRKVAVFPFIPMGGDPALETMGESDAPSPLQMQGGAAAALTDHMIDRLKIMSLDVTRLPDLTRKNFIDMQQGQFSMELPQDTDAFVIGRLFVFRDRRGGNYAIQSPARVAFDFRVVRASDGKTLYFKEYDETQKALLENVFGLGLFIKRKCRWITAGEMATSALDEILDGWNKRIH